MPGGNKVKPFIFDIQRNSFVDGPGIRTTVFFSGCRLRCRWCHNPESWKGEPVLMLYMNRCVCCGKCIPLCPAGAIAIKDGRLGIDRSKCTVCGVCAKACSHGARRICGAYIESGALMKEIKKDQAFYDTSGGGVTFSGGECLRQEEALKDLLRCCAGEGIHTAVDTAGDAPRKLFEEILPFSGLFLYDFKCLDAKKHAEFTGVSNRKILENLVFLLNTAPQKVWIRIPVIPGFNADISELEKIRAWLAPFPPLARIELLPYHRLGENKAEALGMKSVFSSEVPSEETMKIFRDLFGISVN
jgi:pyruvate formate lyase activating enzyme